MQHKSKRSRMFNVASQKQRKINVVKIEVTRQAATFTSVFFNLNFKSIQKAAAEASVAL